MQSIHEALIIFFMIVFNAVFAAYEMALASISRTKLAYLAQAGRKGAAEGLFMKDRMEASLAVVQLGITFVGAIAAATGGAGITEALNPYFQDKFGLAKDVADIVSLIILIIPLSIVTIIFAELIPKTYAIKNSEWVILNLSKTMKSFALIAYPAVSFLENIVKAAIRYIDKKAPRKAATADAQGSLHELTAAISLARTSRLIDAQQEKIVVAAAQLSQRPIKGIMIPIADICMISQTSSLSEALIQAHLDMHTRFPVCEKPDDAQSIHGYINFKDIMAALKINPEDPTIKGIIRPIKRFPQDATISKILEKMIQEKLHIGLVENEHGSIVGMITMEDIIEELVGEIEDEFDRLPNYIHTYGQQLLVGGAAPMPAVVKALGVPWDPPSPAEDNVKLADWCQRKTSKPFNGGEVIPGNGFQITVRKLRRKKISEAFVAKSPQPAA